MPNTDFDRNKSLEELEGVAWGEPPPEQRHSPLVQKVYSLRKLPLNQLTVENIRMLVGQNLSMDYTMPLAIEWLQKDPWRPGGSHVGQLLWFTLHDNGGSKCRYWVARPEMRARMSAVCSVALTRLLELDDLSRAFVDKETHMGPKRIPSLVAQLRKFVKDDEG